MIIIGDVHGNFDTLMALLAKIPESEKAKGIVFVGDLIDRGPKSKQVVEWVMKNAMSVTGNHEYMMVSMVKKQIDMIKNHGRIDCGTFSSPDVWMMNGGLEALASYVDGGITDVDNVSFDKLDLKTLEDHIKWMENLDLFLEFTDVKNDKGEHLLVTHSSATDIWSWSEERRTDMYQLFRDKIIWGRPSIIRPISNIFNVFGHTPISNGPRIKSCYANVDTGCFYNHREYFQLTALQFPEMTVYQQECIDTPVYKQD